MPKDGKPTVVIRKPRGKSIKEAINDRSFIKKVESHIKRIKGK